MRIRKPDQSLNLAELREEVYKHKEKGRLIVADLKSLLSHYEKMQEYYEEWESELNRIQEAINQASEKHNIPKEEVEEYDILSELFGESQ